MVLLFELVDMAFEDVIANAVYEQKGQEKLRPDDVRDILVPPIRDGVELEG